MTPLRKTLLVKNIVSYFNDGTPLRPWVKDWIVSWYYVHWEHKDSSYFYTSDMFATGRGHLQLLGIFNHKWNIQSVPFLNEYQRFVDEWMESISLVDKINKELGIKCYYYHCKVFETNWWRKTTCKKRKGVSFGRNYGEILNRFPYGKSRKDRIIKIERIKEGGFVGPIMIQKSQIEIPYMMEKIFGKND